MSEDRMSVVARQRLRYLTLTLSAARLLPNRLRPMVLRRAGMAIHERVSIFGGTTVTGPARLHIGQASFINHECYLECAADIVIGSGVAIGPRTRLLTSTHEIGLPEQRAGKGVADPVRIGDGCWLGAGVTVLPGVTIGTGGVIAAGSVVTSDTEPNAVYAGVPARRLRTIDEDPEVDIDRTAQTVVPDRAVVMFRRSNANR